MTTALLEDHDPVQDHDPAQEHAPAQGRDPVPDRPPLEGRDPAKGPVGPSGTTPGSIVLPPRRHRAQVRRPSRSRPVSGPARVGAAPRLRVLPADAGMATAEYAIATVAAAGFGGLLILILRSDEVRGLLLGIVRGALSV
ncbi:DUF4244 domain-containing protein [Actinotalea sp. K2]|uniref:DUF4244 domain-containing protein n=1 Tax=Actinotalea sp. K2 TaxID=2939438 RepID=UPI0020180698|nr:DUF4244 domain-containing protein [Actinotalea sp. K2]MCL3861372.1 DUF4244 domain-containing protein [Actinotalea sp. K2]